MPRNPGVWGSCHRLISRKSPGWLQEPAVGYQQGLLNRRLTWTDEHTSGPSSLKLNVRGLSRGLDAPDAPAPSRQSSELSPASSPRAEVLSTRGCATNMNSNLVFFFPSSRFLSGSMPSSNLSNQLRAHSPRNGRISHSQSTD